MSGRKQLPDLVRKIPFQVRAEQTLETFYEATAQIVEGEGEEKLTTNRIAERAGFSIGTLYQYFPNKEALLVAMAEYERKRVVARICAALRENSIHTPEAVIRSVVRIMLQAFKGRFRARRRMLKAIHGQGMTLAFAKSADEMAKVVAEEMRSTNIEGLRPLNEVSLYLVSRVLLGTIRLAVAEQTPFLSTPAFEDELVALLCGYLQWREP
jgi:AcrR family transcriptional regulator